MGENYYALGNNVVGPTFYFSNLYRLTTVAYFLRTLPTKSKKYFVAYQFLQNKGPPLAQSAVKRWVPILGLCMYPANALLFVL